MEVKQTEEFAPTGPSTSQAQNRINVFGGPILKRSMIRQDLEFVGANPRLILFQSADYSIYFLLTRQPLHLAWGWLAGQKCKRVMIQGGFSNLFKDGSDRLPGCVGSFIEGLVEFRHMQRGDFAEGRPQVMERFLAFICPLVTHL